MLDRIQEIVVELEAPQATIVQHAIQQAARVRQPHEVDQRHPRHTLRKDLKHQLVRQVLELDHRRRRRRRDLIHDM